MSDDLLPKWAQNLNTQAVYDVSKRILENNQTLKEENKRLREALERLTRAATELGVDPLDGNLQDKVIDALDAAVALLKEE